MTTPLDKRRLLTDAAIVLGRFLRAVQAERYALAAEQCTMTWQAKHERPDIALEALLKGIQARDSSVRLTKCTMTGSRALSAYMAQYTVRLEISRRRPFYQARLSGAMHTLSSFDSMPRLIRESAPTTPSLDPGDPVGVNPVSFIRLHKVKEEV